MDSRKFADRLRTESLTGECTVTVDGKIVPPEMVRFDRERGTVTLTVPAGALCIFSTAKASYSLKSAPRRQAQWKSEVRGPIQRR